VKASAAAYGKTSDTLEVLVNDAGAAGYGGYAVSSEASLEDMRAVYETNVFGPVRVPGHR
jgi:NAD(P)-dependent dehydrogenase (short-subunit alcohol dehydrogenase family)